MSFLFIASFPGCSLRRWICALVGFATLGLPAVAQREGGLAADEAPGIVEVAAVPVDVDAPSTVLAEMRVQQQTSAAASIKVDPEDAARHMTEAQRNTACETGAVRGRPCRVSWARVLGESFLFLSAQHGGNIFMDRDTRLNLTHGPFWGDYVYCVEHYRYSRWKDDDPFGVDYVGHPMMGAMTNSIYEQNDPKQRALMFENTRRYWMGRLRATAYSAVYSAQWKVGPLSEASIGNTGIGYYTRASDGLVTNETGMQDFFVTPIGGLAWNVGEDVIDRYLFRRVQHAHPRNKPLLIVASLMTPLKSAANLTRFRAFYYRDLDVRTAALR